MFCFLDRIDRSKLVLFESKVTFVRSRQFIRAWGRRTPNSTAPSCCQCLVPMVFYVSSEASPSSLVDALVTGSKWVVWRSILERSRDVGFAASKRNVFGDLFISSMSVRYEYSTWCRALQHMRKFCDLMFGRRLHRQFFAAPAAP